jgi:transcription antitermination factor NusG
MWSVAQLRPTPKAASVAIINLERQGFGSFNPTFATRELQHKQLHPMLHRQVFPGYIFVNIREDQRWSSINYTLGILRLLTRQSSLREWREPYPISDAFVARLQSCTIMMPKIKTGRYPLAPASASCMGR